MDEKFCISCLSRVHNGETLTTAPWPDNKTIEDFRIALERVLEMDGDRYSVSGITLKSNERRQIGFSASLAWRGKMEVAPGNIIAFKGDIQRVITYGSFQQNYTLLYVELISIPVDKFYRVQAFFVPTNEEIIE